MPQGDQVRHLPLSSAPAAANILRMRQLPEYYESCRHQIATLETCVLPDGTQKRGAEGGIRCLECAAEGRS